MPVPVAAHPLLVARFLSVQFPRPLGDLADPLISALLALDSAELVAEYVSMFDGEPITSAVGPSGDPLRLAIRDLLRHGGFKPTGRSKPASEYLLKAAADGFLNPINAAVDACNAVSLHSGFPISVVDLDRTSGPLRIAVAPDPAGSAVDFVFNASGQTIDIDGLLCLFDDDGPCANAVKDAQRTKTTNATTRTLSVIWGVRGHEPRLDLTARWYAALLRQLGAEVTCAP